MRLYLFNFLAAENERRLIKAVGSPKEKSKHFLWAKNVFGNNF